MTTASFEGMKVYWLTAAPASLAAPTVANMTAGTEISDFIPVSGVNIAATQNRASIALLGQAFITENMGTHGKSITLTFVRHAADADDDAWNLFDYKSTGYLVIARFGGGVTAADRVEVYQVETSEPLSVPSAENEVQTFTVEMAVQDYSQDAVVAT